MGHSSFDCEIDMQFTQEHLNDITYIDKDILCTTFCTFRGHANNTIANKGLVFTFSVYSVLNVSSVYPSCYVNSSSLIL